MSTKTTDKESAVKAYWEVSKGWNRGTSKLTTQKAIELLNLAKEMGGPAVERRASLLLSQIIHGQVGGMTEKALHL